MQAPAVITVGVNSSTSPPTAYCRSHVGNDCDTQLISAALRQSSAYSASDSAGATPLQATQSLRPHRQRLAVQVTARAHGWSPHVCRCRNPTSGRGGPTVSLCQPRNHALLRFDSCVQVSSSITRRRHTENLQEKKARAAPRACDVPYQQQSRRFVTEPAPTNSTPIKSRLIILDGGSCLGRATRWPKQSLTRAFE
jgi:hypothetical protein